MLRKIRIILALIFFFGTTLLFLDFTGTVHAWLGWMSRVQLIPAILALNIGIVVALIAITIIFGRIYCSVICPLGVFQDIIAWIGKRNKRNPYSYSNEKKILRIVFLAIFIITLVGGIGSIAALLAPYSSYGRIANNLFQPIYAMGNNVLAYFAERINSYAFYHTDVWIKSISTFIIASATAIIIAILAWRNGRTYCNTVCPVGSVLGFISRFSLIKIKIDTNKCKNCGVCAKNCKAACIDSKHHKIDYSRCVVCGDCLKHCEFSALGYNLFSKKTPYIIKTTEESTSEKHTTEQQSTSADDVDTSRRGFLVAAAMATTATAFAQKEKKVNGGLAKIIDKVAPKRETAITPAGSYSAQHFAQHCTACQLCVSVCPNEVLRPSTDLNKLMQPTMSYERGYCRPECTRCSDVCPSGAIKKVDVATKSSTQIGHAVWIKKNCVTLNDGVECGNCARHCPSGAITMVPSNPNDESSIQIPVVNEERCIGCGACENLCPARPFSAIYVEGHEVHKTI
jgi:ferredoxin